MTTLEKAQTIEATCQTSYLVRASLPGPGTIADLAEVVRELAETVEYLEGREAARKSGTKPDTSLNLGPDRRAWLKARGHIQTIILRLIDEAMLKGYLTD